MDRATAIVLTLVGYKVVLMALGLVSRKRTRSQADFFLGGRGLGGAVAALSASASSSSAWTLLGASGAAYKWGLSAIWIWPACVGGFVLNWAFLAPRLRRVSLERQALTTTDVLAPNKEGLNLWVRRVSAAIILLCLGTYVASQFQGAGKTFNETFGLSITHSILLGSSIVVFYTLLGGFWAVSLTDTLQGFMMMVTAILLPVAVLAELGGVAALAQGMARVEQAGFTDLTQGVGWIASASFAVGLMGIGLGYPGQPHAVNRFMALKDDASVVSGRRIAIGWSLIVYTGMLVLGWGGRVLMPELGDSEVVFIALTNALFPSVLAGVMIAAVLSAIMSTADSQLLVAGSAVSHDLEVGKRWFGDPITQSRWVVVLLSVAAVAGAIYGTREIFSQVLFAWTAMGAAFGPLLLVTVTRGTITPRATLLAMVSGFTLSVAAYWTPELKGTPMERVFPFVVAFVIAWRGSAKR